MTVGSDIAQSGPYFPNGVTTAFPFGFDISQASDLAVVWLSESGEETIIPTAAYSVTISETDPGGTVTFGTAPVVPQAGDELWIFLDPQFEQQDRYSDEGPFNQSLLEGSLDRLARLSIWLKNRVDRAVIGSLGDEGLRLPLAGGRANKFLAFDASGNPVVSSGTGADAGLRSDLAVPLGAALVSWIGSGIGAVMRSVLNKLRDYPTVEDYGAVGDDVTDDTAAIQAMIDDVGYFRLLAKTYRITDTLTIPAHTQTLKSIGARCVGQGMEKSYLNCVGMAGKIAIGNRIPTGLYRMSMSDFGIKGDADTCVGFTLTSGADQLYQSEFRNMVLSCAGDSCFKANFHFSCAWYNIHTFSAGGHGIEIVGGNSTVLVNCYAHNSGAGKAGYRIRGGAVLIACNGVDGGGDIWGEFGSSTLLGDPAQGQFRIVMIGCNIEDWVDDAIVLRNTGSLTLETCIFQAKASGTFNSLITQRLTGAASIWKIMERGSIFQSKGSTLAGASRIIMNSSPELIESHGNLFTDVRLANQSLTYTIPRTRTTIPAFSIFAHQFENITYTRSYGFNLMAPVTITANATTFDGTRREVLQTANTVATNLDQVTGGIDGQTLTLLIKDANTTIRHNIGGSGRFNNTSGASIVAANGDVYRYVWNGGGWKQI